MYLSFRCVRLFRRHLYRTESMSAAYCMEEEANDDNEVSCTTLLSLNDIKVSGVVIAIISMWVSKTLWDQLNNSLNAKP